MALTVAVQMDHISGLNIAGDTTFALMLEAQKRGHNLLHYLPERLSMREGRVFAAMEAVRIADEEGRQKPGLSRRSLYQRALALERALKT